MKRMSAIFLVLVLLFSLSACSGTGNYLFGPPAKRCVSKVIKMTGGKENFTLKGDVLVMDMNEPFGDDVYTYISYSTVDTSGKIISDIAVFIDDEYYGSYDEIAAEEEEIDFESEDYLDPNSREFVEFAYTQWQLFSWQLESDIFTFSYECDYVESISGEVIAEELGIAYEP